MTIENDGQNSFTTKLLVKLAKMIAEDLQTKAPSMSADELYENSDFLPIYNETRDYSEKPAGYVCKSKDGVIMRLTDSSVTLEFGDARNGSSEPIWGYIWSKNPKYAKPYLHSELCPYNVGDCCIWKEETYASTIDDNYCSPGEASDDWVKIPE